MPDDAPMLCNGVVRRVSTGRSAAVFPICAPIAASDDFRSPPRLVIVPFRPLRANPRHSIAPVVTSEADTPRARQMVGVGGFRPAGFRAPEVETRHSVHGRIFPQAGREAAFSRARSRIAATNPRDGPGAGSASRANARS
jgi:hypothetical protein